MQEVKILEKAAKQFGYSTEEMKRIMNCASYAIRFIVAGGSNVHIDGVCSMQQHPEEIKYYRAKAGKNNRTIKKILAGKQKAIIFDPKFVCKYGKR